MSYDENGKNLGGRPEKPIDYKQLDELCSIQCTGEEIASILGMCYKTLNEKLKKEQGMGFVDYFKEKSAVGKASLRRRQFKMAEKNPTMSIWLGKQYLDQKDISVQEVRAEIRADVKAEVEAEVRQELDVYGQLASTQVNIDLANISDDDLEKLEDIMKRVGEVNDSAIDAKHKEGEV